MSGLKINRHILILLVFGVLASIVLYSLPKTVVKNEVAEAQPTQSLSETQAKPANHPALSSEQKMEVAKIRAVNSSKQEINLALADYFSGQNLFDSAAFFAEQNAVLLNDEANWIKTGDLYYQAFSLSLNPVNQEKLAEKTRMAYQKALAINPKQLHAKTNMAMTYVSSTSPMQAIMMLRQVLDENPKYVPAIMSMGALSMQSGQYDKAVSRFQQVLAIDAGNLNAQLGLAYSFIELGEKEKAKTLLEHIQKVGVDEVLQNEITKTLGSLK